MRLRNERSNLTFFLASITSSVPSFAQWDQGFTDLDDRKAVSRVHLSVQDISLISRNIAANQHNFQALVSRRLDQHENILEKFLFKSTLPPLLEGAPASAFRHPPGLEEGLISIKSNRSQPELLQEKSRSKTDPQLRLGHSFVNDTAAISASYQKDDCSRKYCSCSCHSSSRLKSPQLLEQFIGLLFVGYTGLPILRPYCTEATCNRNSKSRISFSYCFPRWFLQRALSLALISNPRAGPDFNLKTIRPVDRSADVFAFSLSGNIEGLKHLFEDRSASPLDIAYEGGYTLLHVRQLRLASIVYATMLTQRPVRNR